MKVTLIFLFCFVSLSYQQRWVAYSPVIPRELVSPGYFYRSNPYLQSFNNLAYFDSEVLDGNINDEGSEVEGRISNKLIHQSSPAAATFPRSFFLPNQLWSNLASNFLSYTTTTKTIYTSLTSTTTVATVQSCITSTLFASAAAGGPYSTTPCVRRRRDVLEDLIEKPEIAPSKVEPLVPTVLAVERIDSIIPEISSSLSVPNDESITNKRRSRAAVTIVVNTTSTITTYAFSTTTIKKLYTVGNAAGVLLCLPSGYTAC